MTVFSRGVPLNQVLFICIDICLSCLQVGTRGHLFTSTRCHLFTSTCCHLFTSTRCHLFTRVYNSLQVHVSPRSDVTFGNDVIHHNSTTKSGSKVIFYTTISRQNFPSIHSCGLAVRLALAKSRLKQAFYWKSYRENEK